MSCSALHSQCQRGEQASALCVINFPHQRITRARAIHEEQGVPVRAQHDFNTKNLGAKYERT